MSKKALVFNNFAAILLAAGRGSRMKSNLPKVLHEVNGKPLLTLVLTKIHKLNFGKIIVVVKYGKEKVIANLPDYAQYAEQGDQYGTSKAVESALPVISDEIDHVMVINGDDSLFYSPKTFHNVAQKHIDTNSDVTFITLIKDDPTGYGRVVYDKNGIFQKIVEQKDATEFEQKITEVNDGVYIFKKEFITEFISKIKASPVTGEYYLTDLLGFASKHNKRISTYLLKDSMEFFGISTQEDVEKANDLSRSIFQESESDFIYE